MTLLISAGLFLKSLVNVSRVDLGLQAENIVTFAVSPQLNGYEPARARVANASAISWLMLRPAVLSTGGVSPSTSCRARA